MIYSSAFDVKMEVSKKSRDEVADLFTSGKLARAILKPSKMLAVRYGTRMAELLREALREGLDVDGEYKSMGYATGRLSRSIATRYSVENSRWSTGGYFTGITLDFTHEDYGWDLAEGKRSKAKIKDIIAWIQRKKANSAWTTWTNNKHSESGRWKYRDIAWVIIKRKSSTGYSYKWNDISPSSPARQRFLQKQKAVRPYWLSQFRENIKTNIENYNAHGK